MELSRTRQKQYDNIVDSARELFIAHGIETTSMRDIAAAAGVERKTVYNYFSSKEELATHVLVNMEELGAFFALGDYSEMDGKTGYEMLENILKLWAKKYQDFKDALMFSFQYNYHFNTESQLKDYVSTVDEIGKSKIGRAIKKGLEDGSIFTDGMDAELTSFTVIRMCRSVIEKQLYRSQAVNAELGRDFDTIDHAFTLVLRGLKA